MADDSSWWRNRSVVYLSGTAGDTRRFRCDYAAESLRSVGAHAEVMALEGADLGALADYDCLVLHRVGITPEVAELIARASRNGQTTLYDTDDLVFDSEAASLVTWPANLSEGERRAEFERQRATLRACAGATVSTQPLAALAQQVNWRVSVVPNSVGAEMVAEADAFAGPPTARPAADPETTIVYMSGTPTHDRDFLTAADAVLSVLHRFPVRLLVVGYLELDSRFKELDLRVERLPFQPRARLVELLHGNTINLAPLEAGNPFAASKSCLKYLEAALVGTPTIASRVDDYERAIQHGRNGLLCESERDWERQIERLVMSPELRHGLGKSAYWDVRLRHTTEARASSHARTLRQLIESTEHPVRSVPKADVGDQEELLEEAVDRITWVGTELARLSEELDRREVRLDALERDRDLAERRADDLEAQMLPSLYEHKLDALEDQLEARTAQLESVEGQLAKLRAKYGQVRKKNRRLAKQLAALHASRSWRLTRPLRAFSRVRAPKADSVADEPLAASDADSSAAVLFVSGAPEVSRRYRCEHQAEQLEFLGAATQIALYGEVDLSAASERHAAFVLHRVPWDADVQRFLGRARELGKPVVFDTDDLVFDPDATAHVAALEDLPPAEVRLYIQGLHRYRRTMTECDGVVVSTASLQRLAAEVTDHVVVAPNVAGCEMIARAAEAAAANAARPHHDAVTIGYLSGTNTHKRDFAEAADALLSVLEARPQARLRLVGPLIVDSRFDRFGERVERVPIQPWRRLAALQAGVDINLAPLEPDNPYTDSKSCIKWIEAAVAGVPTVASPRSDFERVIVDGRNGFLAQGTDEWASKLLALVDDPALRRSVGERARHDVLAEQTTKRRAAEYHRVLAGLAVDRSHDPLTINWIMRAPIAQNSGGYRNIFRIANVLGERGHVQRLYVERIAHLKGLDDDQIRDFVSEAFGLPDHSEVIVGHGAISAADVSIATHWPTAAAVAAHERSLFKAYFIQDFEPEFYERSDPHYRDAEHTYHLPLRHICLGEHLARRLEGFTGVPSELVDFALDPCFTLTTPPDLREDPVRVLFFARPNLRRRGYEIGVEALRRVKAERPDAEIMFFGTRTEELGHVPFEFQNLGVLDAESVAAAMNRCHILLTFSLTNISNVPFEGMACGCAVVDLDLPNVTSMVEQDRNCLLADFEPRALADAVVRLVDDRDLRVRLGTQGAEDAKIKTWTRTASMFEEALLRTCFVRLTPAAVEEPSSS